MDLMKFIRPSTKTLDELETSSRNQSSDTVDYDGDLTSKFSSIILDILIKYCRDFSFV